MLVNMEPGRDSELFQRKKRDSRTYEGWMLGHGSETPKHSTVDVERTEGVMWRKHGHVSTFLLQIHC